MKAEDPPRDSKDRPPFRIMVRDDPNPFARRSRMRHMRVFFFILLIGGVFALIAVGAVLASGYIASDPISTDGG